VNCERNRSIIVWIFCWLFTPLLHADTIPPVLQPPTGQIILTIKGHINAGQQEQGVVNFDLAGLLQFPQYRIATKTRWTEGVQSFEGVLVRDLLKTVGAQGSTVTAIALDHYTAPDIPIEDFIQYPIILAIKNHGNYIKIREKGPLWMIYPLDDFPELQKDLLTQYKMVWHLRTLLVK